jgi:hypothetical protein
MLQSQEPAAGTVIDKNYCKINDNRPSGVAIA